MIESDKHERKAPAEIAIIGNPNCGKTSLFNKLTGTRQRTGNWPGVTVERKDGKIRLADQQHCLVDLPGIYTLTGKGGGIDAKVAQEYLTSQQASLVIFVLDATQLARQIMLLAELSALNIPLVVAVNMLDTAEKEGIELNLPLLSEATGYPVVGVSASTGAGIEQLKQTIAEQLPSKQQTPDLITPQALKDLAPKVAVYTKEITRTEQIDRWLLHTWLAVPIFLFVMYALFSISVNVGSVFIDFFDIWLGSWLIDGSRWALTSINAPGWLTAIISDGVFAGIQLVCTFIPVIGCLYLCMSILEDSGYLSRAAFVIDSVMSKIGLPGQAFIPLIVGFGCNVPSVMASRALDRPSARLTTIFIAPFMSCGARLSVYVFVGTALFPNQAQNAIFFLYVLGIAVAVFSAWLLRKSLFLGETQSNLTEMPAYHRPLMRNVLTQSWQRLNSFIFRAGKRIVAVVLVLALFQSWGMDGTWGNQNSEKSVLSYTGKVITPVFEPMGIGEDNWPATVGLFTGLFAKEVVVGTLDTLYSPPQITSEESNEKPDFAAGFKEALASIAENAKGLSDVVFNPLGIDTSNVSNQDTAAEEQGVQQSSYDSMIALFPSAWAAFCYLAFILLYAPCVATIGVMQKEAGHGWLQFSIIWSLLLSYWLASNLWQLSQLLITPMFSASWLVLSTLALIASYKLIVRRVRKQYANEIPIVNLPV